MGQELSSRNYASEAEFRTRLRTETQLIASWYKNGDFARFDPLSIGAEVEAWLVDRNALPAPENAAFLDALADSHATTELAQFNFELNLDPHGLPGGFDDMLRQLETLWTQCRNAASGLDLRPLLIGIPPTLIHDMLSLDTITPADRYRALNERVMQLRGTPTDIDIVGREALELVQDHLMIEAACTSLQTHLSVNPGDETRMYNAAQLASGPLTAISANSPFLYGRRLWEETRIPAFEQAIGLKDFRARDGTSIGRVGFGANWLRRSFMELFLENLDGHAPLLPLVEDTPVEVLSHFRLQNGTLWRWNRPICAPSGKGRPHLRIENRVTPAGPSLPDMVANAAFFVGLTLYLAQLDTPPESVMPFTAARSNFYACARRGLGATVIWTDGESHDVQRLIHDQLAHAAEQALIAAGVPASEAKKALAPILGRARSGLNGAAWQRGWVNCHGRDFQGLVETCLENQQKGDPVHTWRI